VWTVTECGYLAKYTDTGLVEIETPCPGANPNPTQSLHSLYVDRAGRIWVTGVFGIGVFDGQSWTAYNETNSGLPSSHVYAVVEERATERCG